MINDDQMVVSAVNMGMSPPAINQTRFFQPEQSYRWDICWVTFSHFDGVYEANQPISYKWSKIGHGLWFTQ